jgi:ATP-dependent RNA helicase RhlE
VGEAFTFVSPQEEPDLRDIEKAIARRLPRVTVPDFDYAAKAKGKLEIPLAQRIAEIRARKREERRRAEINAARRAAAVRAPHAPRPPDEHRAEPARRRRSRRGPRGRGPARG